MSLVQLFFLTKRAYEAVHKLENSKHHSHSHHSSALTITNASWEIITQIIIIIIIVRGGPRLYLNPHSEGSVLLGVTDHLLGMVQEEDLREDMDDVIIIRLFINLKSLCIVWARYPKVIVYCAGGP